MQKTGLFQRHLESETVGKKHLQDDQRPGQNRTSEHDWQTCQDLRSSWETKARLK